MKCFAVLFYSIYCLRANFVCFKTACGSSASQARVQMNMSIFKRCNDESMSPAVLANGLDAGTSQPHTIRSGAFACCKGGPIPVLASRPIILNCHGKSSACVLLGRPDAVFSDMPWYVV